MRSGRYFFYTLCAFAVCVMLQFITIINVLAQDQSLFENVSTSKTGVKFKNIITESAQYNALTYENLYNGGGVAVGDINNDGLDDIYFVSNMGQNKLYLNLGNFKFKDVTTTSGTGGHAGWKSGAAMVDINGDGLLDIYACYSGKTDPEKRRNQFFINQGNLTFSDQAKAMGLDDNGYTTQSAYLDYDRDGDLDVFLLETNVKVIRDLEYADARKQKDPYAGDKLFRNDGGKFREVTEEAGILSNALGFGLGVAVADINNDGWQDLYISNDYAEPDYLYINNGDGTFTDQLTTSLQHISQFSMGSDIADINNDAWPDIFTADMLPEDNKRQKILYGPDNYEQFALMVNEGFHYQNMRNMLQLSNGNGTFSEIGQLAGVSNTDWSWAPLIADYDNDGWKDLFVTNGYFRDYTNRDFLKYKGDYYFKKAIDREKPDTLQLAASMPSTPIHNYMFRNSGDLTFSDESKSWGFEKKTFSNGAAYADLDNDGDLDLVVSNQGEEASLYKNLSREEKTGTNYITIQLKGLGNNSKGLGAKVTVYTAGTQQMVEQSPVRGYQSSVSYALHFGLGEKSKIDSIRIKWLSGSEVLLKDVNINQILEVKEGVTKGKKNAVCSTKKVLFEGEESPLQYKHTEYGANDFKRQPLLMTMFSNCGPIMASADVNGDGLTDVFVGGTKENPGNLFLQTVSGDFIPSKNFYSKESFYCTDADAAFFDSDGDGDMDLYVASGGYHDYEINDKNLQDRLFINDGKGSFQKSDIMALPKMLGAKSCVRPTDFDRDGDLDLFVGGRVIPGNYPLSPESYLLENDGTGRFTNVTNTLFPEMVKGGMVTDAVWIDVNQDQFPDLITAGEFMPIQIFLNESGKKIIDRTSQYFDQLEHGLWNRLAIADFDHDGDIDFIAGNFGLNTQVKASALEPLTLTYSDFDKNGSIDPILVSYIQRQPYPFAGRDEMLDQIYSLRKKFTSYGLYSEATLTDIFSKQELSEAKTLTATELRTAYFENKGNKFIKHVLPREAQFAPVYAIEITDFNHDGNPDFIIAGNQTSIRIRLGAIDANYGQLYQGDGRGNFIYVPQALSGLSIVGDVKSLKVIKAGGGDHLFIGVNNTGIISYKLNVK